MKFNNALLKLIVLHLSLMVVAVNLILFLFFQFILPVMTQHGQFITVPSLRGIDLEEVDICLSQRNLRFEVTEAFAYASDYPPMVVLQQYPKAGSRVKEGRKIYLTLNTQTPPKVKMPHLIDGSVRNAHVCLKSQGLLLGSIKYVPDIAQNAVLEQRYRGQEIPTGTLIALGTKIDLVVGAGLGNQMVEVPSIVGMKLEDAKFLLLSIGIKIGNTIYKYDTNRTTGTIVEQRPGSGQQVSVGDNIDLWLAQHQEAETFAQDVSILP